MLDSCSGSHLASPPPVRRRSPDPPARVNRSAPNQFVRTTPHADPARARTDQVEAHRSSARCRALTEPHAAAAAQSYPAAGTTSSTTSTSSTSRGDVSTELHHSRVGPTFSAATTGGGAQRRMWTELPGGSDDHELPAAATSSSFCAGNPRSSSAPASSIKERAAAFT
jgi:hypothetical protein